MPAEGAPRERAHEERNVAIEVSTEDDQPPAELERKLGALNEEVVDRGGVPLRAADGTRYGARFSVVAPDPGAAVEEGLDAFKEAAAAAGVPDSPVVEVEAKTLDELADEHDGDEVPDLIDIQGLADVLGVGHRVATILIRSMGFPPPAAELNAGPVWTRASVERFLRRTQRMGRERPGELPDRAERALAPEED